MLTTFAVLRGIDGSSERASAATEGETSPPRGPARPSAATARSRRAAASGLSALDKFASVAGQRPRAFGNEQRDNVWGAAG